jgi:hypothetical protein
LNEGKRQHFGAVGRYKVGSSGKNVNGIRGFIIVPPVLKKFWKSFETFSDFIFFSKKISKHFKTLFKISLNLGL